MRVRDGEAAVFVYRQKNGVMQDFIEGPFTQKIKTSNLPVLAGIVSLAYAGGTPFQAKVGTAGAEALGKMGANSAGGVSLDGSPGFHPAAIMAGMALGGAVGQNLVER